MILHIISTAERVVLFMRFRIILFFVVFTLCIPVYAQEDPPETAAKAALVLHGESGTVLCEENADEFLPIASTTKIMTALIVLEQCDLSDLVTIQPEDTGIEGSGMGFEAGEVYTVEELLYGLMLASGHDVAAALARYTAGSEAAFAELMNEKAAALGLRQTHFENPHGLDAEGHGSTARELALLAAAAMENPDFREIVATERKTVGDKTYVNHNRLLRSYPGAIGVKTGYTMAAGRILVSCAKREDMELICVTISDPEDWDDHAALLDWAFEHYAWRVCRAVGYRLPVFSGQDDACLVLPEHAPALLTERGERLHFRAELPRFVFAPISPGQKLGTLTVTAENGAQASVPLVCAGSVEADKQVPLSFAERIGRFWRLAGRAFLSFNPVILR